MDKEKKILKVTRKTKLNYFKETTLMTADFSLKIKKRSGRILNRY